MSEPIKMPQLGESVTEGTISRWLVAEGEEIRLDEPIAEIDTDKVSSELPSSLAGRLEKILVGEGETVDVGVEIASVAVAGETSAGVTFSDGEVTAEEPSEGPTEEFPAAGTVAQPVASEARPSAAPSGGNGHSAPPTAGELRLRRSSPVVRRLAAEHGVEISNVPGSGAGGRVTKKDILSFVEDRKEEVAPEFRPEPERLSPPEPSVPEPSVRRVEAQPGDEVVEATRLRRAIAGRMSLSKREAPHAWAMVEADVTGLAKLRESEKETFRRREGVGLSYLPFIVRAVARSLKEHPVLNSVWDGERIVLRKKINIGLAVDTADPEDGRFGALVVPVIKGADDYGIVGLARRSDEVVRKARAGKLAPDDVSGGTFTVNNPGALGSLVSTPIINYPQVAILSAEAVVKRPVVLEEFGDAIAVRSMMNLEVSFDHRALDGGAALRFLNAVKRRLEGYTPEGEVS